MEINKNVHIKNWSSVIGQTCQAWNRLGPKEYDIEVTLVCPLSGRNFDNRVLRFIFTFLVYLSLDLGVGIF